MKERDFWKTTPVRIRLLSQKHFEIISPDSVQKIATTVEELPFMV